jgi:ferredoxin
MGIPDEDMPHLFEPFYRGARARATGNFGSGLGLAIAKEIVSVHGGRMSATSAPGEGTTLTVRLPAEFAATAPAVTAPAVPAVEVRPAVELATRVLRKEAFRSFIEAVMSELPLFVVKARDGMADRFVFGPLENVDELRLDYDVTILPPKKYLMPPRETLCRFTLGAEPTAKPCIERPEPTVLMGVHPYDMVAINQLDRLMANTNPDPNYLARRAALTIIGVDPVRASERAFWSAMGCSVVDEGFDLWLTDVGHTYVVEEGSQKGAALLEEYAETRDPTDYELEARARLRAELRETGGGTRIRFQPTELPALLRHSFDHPIWAEQAEKCLSCGSCNLVCPTCYCFDVKDDVDIAMKEGERYRVWDGCALEDFAKVGTGENFREKRVQRYRHRFYRKGMYLYDKYGLIACVGCGRCAAACLSDIADPVKAYNALKEGKEHDAGHPRRQPEALHA